MGSEPGRGLFALKLKFRFRCHLVSGNIHGINSAEIIPSLLCWSSSKPPLPFHRGKQEPAVKQSSVVSLRKDLKSSRMKQNLMVSLVIDVIDISYVNTRA